jgi:hypothetical protein
VAARGWGGVTIEQGIEVGAGAQFLDRPEHARVPQGEGAAGELLVSGQHVGGRQAVAGQGGGAGVFLPPAHPRVLLRLLPSFGRRFRIHRDHRASQRGAQLPGRLPRRLGQDPVLHRAGVGIGQDPGRLSDQPGLGSVDATFLVGAGGAGQPDRQIQRQIGAGAGGLAGQGQRRADLITGELADLLRELPGGWGCRRQALLCRDPGAFMPGGVDLGEQLLHG